MLDGIIDVRFYDMSHRVRSRGKKTAQRTHCAVQCGGAHIYFRTIFHHAMAMVGALHSSAVWGDTYTFQNHSSPCHGYGWCSPVQCGGTGLQALATPSCIVYFVSLQHKYKYKCKHKYKTNTNTNTDLQALAPPAFGLAAA